MSPSRRSSSAPPAKRQDAFRILTINPGSMSTKVAIFHGDRCIHETEVAHEVPPAQTLEQRTEQIGQRASLVRDVLDTTGLTELDAVVGRGGFLPRPVGKLRAGTYIIAERRDDEIVIDEPMVQAILERPEMDHASNVGIPTAAMLARQLGVPAFVVNPVVTDEFPPEAELSGYAPVARKSTAHALSVHAVARKAARQLGIDFQQARFVVVHMGGGITVAAVRDGRMVDNNVALLGGGPFTPQRAGHLDVSAVMDLCFSGRFDRDRLAAELTKRAGLVSYIGEHRMEVIEKRIAAGDDAADLAVDGMVYQMAKEVGAMVVAAGCRIDAVVLTGGLARSKLVLERLESRVGKLAPFVIFPGSLEMDAMAEGAAAVLSGERPAMRYVPPD